MDGDEAASEKTDGSRYKYRNVNVASIADLKAELYKKQQEFRQQKPKAPGTSAVQARSAPQKPNIWSKKNAGVLQRAANDFTAKVEEEDALAKSRRALEAKAKLYDELAQSALVAKRSDDESSDDDTDEGESRYLVDFGRKLDDEWVDYVDSLGRSRRCLRRDLPSLISMDRSLSAPSCTPTATASEAMDERGAGRAYPPSQQPPVDADSLTLLSDDMRREMLRQKWEKEEQEAREKNRDVHYANVRFDEIRDHGAGFYEFSKDEAERAEEMKKLASLRQQTLHDRAHDEKLKQLREEMVHVRLEMKRLQYLCRPGSTVGSVPSDETRRKAEHQKIDALRIEIANTGGAKEKLDLQVELQLRLEIAGLRSAFFAPRGTDGSQASLIGASSISLSGGSQQVYDQSPAGRMDAPSDSTDDDADEVGPLPADIPLLEDIPLPPSPQPQHPSPDGTVGSREASSTDKRSDVLKKLQAALLRLTKMQLAQVEKLQRSKKRGPDEVMSSAASTIAAGAPAISTAATGDNGFVGPRPRPVAAAGSVREWDVGKPGIPTSVKSGAPPAKKSWKEERREERNEEFAPPSCYSDEHTAAGSNARSHRGRQAGASSVDRSHRGSQPIPAGVAFPAASVAPNTNAAKAAVAMCSSGVPLLSASQPAVADPVELSDTSMGWSPSPADLSHGWAAAPQPPGSWTAPPPPFSSLTLPLQPAGTCSFAGPPAAHQQQIGLAAVGPYGVSSTVPGTSQVAGSDPRPPGTVSADRCWSAADFCRDPRTSSWSSAALPLPAAAVGVGFNPSIPPPDLRIAPQAAAVRASWQEQQHAPAVLSSMPPPISCWDAAAASQPCPPVAATNAFGCESATNPAVSSVEASVEAVLRSLRGVVQQ